MSDLSISAEQSLATFETLPEIFNSWIQPIKDEAAKTQRLAKIVFETKVAAWRDPIKERVSLRQGDSIIELDTTACMEEFDLREDIREEIDDISLFVQDAKSYGLFFKVDAYQADDKNIGSKTVWVIQKGDIDEAHIRQRCSN
jgi:hypothetical protein